jgi:hypothetical protein
MKKCLLCAGLGSVSLFLDMTKMLLMFIIRCMLVIK